VPADQPRLNGLYATLDRRVAGFVDPSYCGSRYEKISFSRFADAAGYSNVASATPAEVG
jgi:hypothetical protein